jgi:hypothetical protein
MPIGSGRTTTFVVGAQREPTSLLGDYAALAGQRPLASDLWLAEDASQKTVAPAVRVWLERHRRWLLVLDNIEEPAASLSCCRVAAPGMCC